MELVYYTLVGVVLYLVSDWIVLKIEAIHGARMEHRSLLFFAIILVTVVN